MAIKITDEIITDKGITTELYINICSVEYNKNIGDMVINLNVYKNQLDRQEGERCKTFVIPKSIISKWGVEELTDNAFVVAYNKLGEYFNEYRIEKI